MKASWNAYDRLNLKSVAPETSDLRGDFFIRIGADNAKKSRLIFLEIVLRTFNSEKIADLKWGIFPGSRGVNGCFDLNLIPTFEPACKSTVGLLTWNRGLFYGKGAINERSKKTRR